MAFRILVIQVCAVALATCLPVAAIAHEPLAIIEQVDGISQHGQNPPRSAWFALVGGSRLAPTHLFLKQKRNLTNADESGDLDVWTSSHPSASYLLRHASLIAGPVDHVHLPDDSKISDGTETPGLILRFRKESYAFAVERLSPADPGLRRITVKTSSWSSLLYDWRQSHSTNDNYEIVRWAGDLDRDGRLDLIVDFTTYGSTSTCLFLSGPAKPPSLMKRIGCWFTSA